MGLKTVKMPIGMRKSWYFPIVSQPENAHPVYAEPLDMGAARTGNLTVTTATLDIPGDDILQLHVEKFSSGTLAAETDCDDLELNAIVFGHRFESGVEISGGDDVAPDGGYAFIEPILRKDKSVIFRATFLLKVTAQQSTENQNAATRQPGTIEAKTKTVSYMVMEDNAGDWRLRQEFSTEQAAADWIMATGGATNVYRVTVLTSGDGTATPSGTFYVKAGENAVIDFGTDDPDALYDNGSSVTSSIASHKYTLSGVSAAHDIVAIWA